MAQSVISINQLNLMNRMSLLQGLLWMMLPVMVLCQSGPPYIAMQIDEAEGQTFDEAFELGLSACMNAAHVFFTWRDIEPDSGEFSQEKLALLDIVDVFYSAHNIPIEFQLAVINTVTREVPEDLAAAPFDSETFINRFKVLFDTILTHLPQVDLKVLNIGNEIDIMLGNSGAQYDAYQSFFTEARQYARKQFWQQRQRELPVGITFTSDGALDAPISDRVKNLNELADVVSITYYPLNSDGNVHPPNVVHNDFAKLVSAYPDKPIYLVECGYPSSSILGSSDELQRQFWEQVFLAWDQYRTQIPWLMIFKLSDWSQESVDTLAQYYGFPDNIKFKEFLRTLGIRTYANGGVDKPAFTQILCEVSQRKFCNNKFESSPDWESIKGGANIEVNPDLADQFEDPFLQPLHVGGWEDGVYISRDGLHLYAFYSPLDLISFEDYALTTTDDCFNFAPYYRGPLLGMDTITNPAGCPSWIHSDIIYARRTDIAEPFSAWRASNLATPVWYEGAPQMIMKNDSLAEIFVFTRSTPETKIDIMWMKDVGLNPADEASPMPAPITTTGIEDNPHLERIDDQTLVLFFDNDGDVMPSDLWWSISHDNGITWQSKQRVHSVSTDRHDVQPHLWLDKDQWWLYFTSEDPNSGKLAIYRAAQTIPGNWDGWGPAELVLSAADISSGKGEIFGIGEPTLTQWGDISFVVVYGDITVCNQANRVDADPWFLPRKGSPVITSQSNWDNSSIPVRLYPNPTTNYIQVVFEYPTTKKSELVLVDAFGHSVNYYELERSSTLLQLEGVSTGMYFYEISIGNQGVARGKIVVN